MEVIEVTEREVEIIEVIERGPAGPAGPQPDINYTVVSSARTLEAADLIAADTSGGAFTLTLPLNPSSGDAVDIFDFSETFDTNPLTIARNGSRIESLEENLVCNVEGAYFTLIYTGSTRGWQVLPRYGTSGGGGESALTTQGDMLYRGAAVNTRLGIGTAGQILKVNSSATAPEWGEAPATGVTSVSGTAPIASSGGATPTISISSATTSAAGSMSSADKTKLDGIAANANNYAHPNHSGDVTSVGDGATTIANDAVTNAKLANVATSTIKGRATAGTGDPEDLSASQVRTILNVADGAEVNVQSDWTESNSALDSFILNKPATFTPSSHTHGNITNDGKITGAGSGLPVVTTTDGAVTTLALGTANQVLRVNSGATGVEFGAGFDAASPPAIGNTTPNSGAFTTLSANNGTLTASAPVLHLAQTWNNAAVTFSGARIDITNTASATGSRFLDCIVGGASAIRLARISSIPYALFGTADTGIGAISTSQASIIANGGVALVVNSGSGGAYIRSDASYAWASGTNLVGASLDLTLARDAANTLAQRRSTNPQTFRLYNTFSDASNHERGFMRWSSNVLQIGTEKAGTGSARALALQTDGTTRVTIDTTGQIGIGVAPERPFHIQGSAAFVRVDRQGNFGPALLLTRMATGTTVTSSWLFGPTDQVAGVSNDDFAIIDFGTAVSGTSGTQRLTISKSTGQLTVNGNLNLSTKNLVTDTTTGTKIGTGTTQKLGFFNATPVVQQAAIADATDAATTQARLNDLLAAVRTLGLIAT